jgi:hypothetical protein
MAGKDGITEYDGSIDFSGGVDSLKVTTLAGPRNPNGLARNQEAWLVNCTVRDGGITQRTGWENNGVIRDGSVIFQGSSIYQPDSAFPYVLAAFGGHIWQIDPDFAYPPIDLSARFGVSMSPTQTQYFFAQGENYMVIQDGSYSTLPLFWDGTTLSQSIGITNSAVAPGTPGVNEIPAGGPMIYYEQRLWWAIGRAVYAGDIVGGNSGVLAPAKRDAILNVTENPLVLGNGGDGFAVPSSSGNIRALSFCATLDATLGQGNLIIFTLQTVYSLFVPITRADWIAANTTNAPLMTVIQINNGTVNDRSIVSVNGDLFFQSLEPAVRSLISAIRYYGQWSNPPTSSNEYRILQFNDRALMPFATGIQFDERLLQAISPIQLPQCVVHQAIIPLDFTPLSTLGTREPPCWEGHYEGLQHAQLLQEDYGGRPRAFSVVVSTTQPVVYELWELTDANKFENGDNRVTWQIEFPAYTWGDEMQLKRLTSGRIWVDSVFGKVDFSLDYRPDSDVCWHPWKKWSVCTARTSEENVQNPQTYPLLQYGESYKLPMTLPMPPSTDCSTPSGRPSYIGYQFQPRLTIIGWCRIRGIWLGAKQVEEQEYQGLVC